MKSITKKVSETQYRAAVTSYADAYGRNAAIQVKKNAEISKVTAKYADEEKQLNDSMELQFATVKTYCEQNRIELFKEKKSYVENGFKIGFKKVPASLALLAGHTWEMVIAALKKKKLTDYIRTKEEVDKTRLKNDEKALGTKLAQVGVKVDGGNEEFLMEPAAK